jgi:hypothetical protein
MSADFTPEAVRDILTVAGLEERKPGSNMTGYQIGDARETLGEILIKVLVKLSDPPRVTDGERRAQAELVSGYMTFLRDAGYTGSTISSTTIVITGSR